MPTFNAAAYLQDSIESILNQSFTDFDFYIYDDFSTDNTEEIIKKYKDDRIYYIKNNQNLGIAKTLNIGLEQLLPKYEYIARMDADDWSFENRLQEQLDFLEKNHQISVLGTQGYWLKNILDNPKTSWTYPLKHQTIKFYLLFTACFGHSSLMFKSNFFQKNNLRYDESIVTCEDWDLWIRVVLLGEVANLPTFLMKYRIVANSNHRSADKIASHLLERAKIISKHWRNFGIIYTPDQVFDFYFSTKKELHFEKKLLQTIQNLNHIYLKSKIEMTLFEQKQFRIMMVRKILQNWKNANHNRFNWRIWVLIFKNVTFADPFELFKNLIK